MEPEAQVLRDKCKRALGDPVAMALLAYRVERHGCLLLLWLYADVEVSPRVDMVLRSVAHVVRCPQMLIELFDKNGRLFTEQDVRSLYRKYFRGDDVISDQPGVRHQMKLLRSKATKGQLETAGQYVAQLRRVQAELWPLLQFVLEDFFSERGGVEARLSEGGPGVDLATGALVSGLAGDVVLWSVQQNDLLAWTGLWLTFRPFCSANDVVATLCDVAEFGADSLPAYACYPAKHHATASLGVRRNAVKLILLGQLMQAVVEQDLQERLTMRMYRLIGQLSVADQGTGDVQLAGLARGWQVRTPPAACVERFVERWQRAIDEPAPPSALNIKFDVMKTDPARMAEHLTRTDCALFWSVSLADFQRFCGLAPDKGKAEGGVFRLIEKRFDRMVWVVLSMICWSDNTTELLAYWIAVLEELERLNNWHSLMMLSSVLNHYLVEFMKKSWAALPPEATRAVQRVSALFFPGNNYREYRTRYKERVLRWANAHLFAGGAGEEKSFFGLAMPLLQRDVIIGSEMPSYFEHLRPPGTINCQRLRVLGEAVSMFWLARTAAGHFLGGCSTEASDDELLNSLLALPWTDDEDLLIKVARRGQGGGSGSGHINLKPIRRSEDTPPPSPAMSHVPPSPAVPPLPLGSAAAMRSGYLPGMPPPAAAAVVEPSEDASELDDASSGAGGPSGAPGAAAAQVVVVRNPLLDLVAARPSRAVKLAKLLKRPVITKLALPTPGPLSPRASSPRARMISPRQPSAASGLGELLSPRLRKQNSKLQMEVQWCEECKARRALEGTTLCTDCVSSTRGSDLVTLVIKEGAGGAPDKRQTIRRSATYAELQYVLQCELGDWTREAAWLFRINGEDKKLADTSDWDLALLRCKGVSELVLITFRRAAPAMVPEPVPPAPEEKKLEKKPAPPQVKRQKSRWGTLKRGLTLKFGKGEKGEEEAAGGQMPADGPLSPVTIVWCASCHGRKATQDELCDDCRKSVRASRAETGALVLAVQGGKSGEQRLLVDLRMSWKEASYVLATVDEAGVFAVAGERLRDEESWRAALETAADGVVRVERVRESSTEKE